MKKTSFLLPIAMLSMLIVATPASHAYAAKVYKQTATVYQIKKTGKTYKITSQAKKTTDQDINVGKSVVIKGQRYYYSNVFKGYITDKSFALNAKLDEKRDKYNKSTFATDKNKNKNTTTNSSNTTNTSSNSNIKDGYDYKNDAITDYQTYSSVYLKTILNDINQNRNSKGVNALSLDSTLSNIASQRAKQGYDLRNASWYDGHRDQNGNFYFVNMAQQMGVPYTVFGENVSVNNFSGTDGILEGPTEAAHATVAEWADEGPSGRHYQNMMNPQFKKIGIGLYVGPNQGQQTSGGEAEDYTD